MTTSSTIMNKFFRYSKERFPLPGVMLYAGTLFLLPYSFAGVFPGRQNVNIADAVIGFAVLFLVFLHLRIFDEHKDAEKDTIAYPDRMLSKGLITLADLRAILTVVLFVEFGFSAFLGLSAFIAWSAVMLWSLLMFVEFFLPGYLNRHLGLYLVSHQIIVPITCLFSIAIRVPGDAFCGPQLLPLAIFCLAIMMATITYEIARKTWSPDREHADADSYTKVWGIRGTVAAGQVAALAAALLFGYLYSRYNRADAHSVAAAVLYLVFLASGILFAVKPEHRNSKIVEGAGILFMLGIFINGIAAFCCVR